MPIIAKKELEARRAARAALPSGPDTGNRPSALDVVADPGATVPGLLAAGKPADVPADAPVAKAKKPAAKRREVRPKKQPTGDYAEGYCRPPVRHRFDGSRAGPGRPRGAVSQDTLLKKHLSERRPVAINGRQSRVQARELVIMLRCKEALAGNRHAQDFVLAHAARLFAEKDRGSEEAATPETMDEHDRAMLEALRATLFCCPGPDGGEAGDEDSRRDDDAPEGERA